MKFAITGSSGYIGGWLTKTLKGRGHEVHTQDAKGDADSLFDLRDHEKRPLWLKMVQPDVVVHLAALYGRIWGEKDLTLSAEINAGLTAEVARDTAAVGARLMYMSSSEIYGDACIRPEGASEVSELKPLNMYGLTKKWGEEAAKLYAPNGLMITRLNMPYGPAAVLPKVATTPEFSGRAGILGYNAMHTMLWQASHDMPITVHTGCVRSFTFVGDTCRGLAMIAESGKSGTWNVHSNANKVSMEEIAERSVALVPGCKSQITVEEPNSQITKLKNLSNDLILSLGWKPKVTLDVGMSRTLDYMERYDRDGRWIGCYYP